MANGQRYVCTGCREITPRELLLAKKVVFLEIGVRPKQARSRTAAWLCPKCLSKDPHWNLEAYVSPGTTDVDEFKHLVGEQ